MIVAPWELERAQRFVADTREVITAGVGGAESLPALLAEINSAADPSLRRSVYALFRALGTVEPWQRPDVFKNSWIDYNTARHTPVGYMRDPFGFVHLRGLIKRTVAGFSGIVMFTLPEQYRPILSSNFAVVGNNKFARLEVYANGALALVAADSATPETFVSLDGVTFDTRP